MERISPDEAQCIYAWGKTSVAKEGYSRWKAKIFTGPKAKIENYTVGRSGTYKFTFEMGEDLKTIVGLRQFEGKGTPYTSKVVMKKVEQD